MLSNAFSFALIVKSGEGRSNATPVRGLFVEARTLSNDCEDAILLQIYALHHRRQSTVILGSILAIGCSETEIIFYF